MNYKIIFTKTLSKEIEIDADSTAEAVDKGYLYLLDNPSGWHNDGYDVISVDEISPLDN